MKEKKRKSRLSSLSLAGLKITRLISHLQNNINVFLFVVMTLAK